MHDSCEVWAGEDSGGMIWFAKCWCGWETKGNKSTSSDAFTAWARHRREAINAES